MGFALSAMTIESSAFSNGSRIPTKHTGEGEDISPPLTWVNPPEGARSFAVLCHDPDAPLVSPGTYGFVHWVVYNLPGSTRKLTEGASEGTVGKNDFGNRNYGGPMPPQGHGTHHYYFWVLALDRELNLDAGLTLWEFLEEAEPSVIGMNRLIGTYSRT